MPKTENITIETPSGVALRAKLDYAVGRRRGWAIFAHCFSCSKDSLAATRISQELAMEGIGTLRLDFTGLGQSEGAFEDTSFTSNLDDIRVGADWLTEHHGAPELLVGHSLGGAAVLAVAKSMASIKGVATLGAPAEASHVKHLFESAVEEIKSKGVAEVSIGGRPLRIGKGFLDDLVKHDGGKIAAELGKDLLVLHSPIDSIVGIENAAAIYTAARHPKSFVSLDKADHLLSKREDSAFAAKVISAWAWRCLEADASDIGDSASDEVIVSSSSDGIFAHDISVGVHRLRVDEPPSYPGGLDSGPAPYDFLKASLGACTAITIRMVAERKGWQLEACEVEVLHRKEGEGAEAKDIFTRKIILAGALDDEQRQFLLGIANKCPVHRTLEGGSEVETELLKAEKK